MTVDNVEYLPVWKKDSTAEEFFMECAMMARKHPEWVRKIAIVSYEEAGSADAFRTRIWRWRCESAVETLGLMEAALQRYHMEMYGL